MKEVEKIIGKSYFNRMRRHLSTQAHDGVNGMLWYETYYGLAYCMLDPMLSAGREEIVDLLTQE
jgi:hypothetical protein